MVYGIFTYIDHQNPLSVAKYAISMDDMGFNLKLPEIRDGLVLNPTDLGYRTAPEARNVNSMSS